MPRYRWVLRSLLQLLRGFELNFGVDKATKERERLRSVLQEAEDEEAQVLEQVERCRKQLKELKPLVSGNLFILKTFVGVFLANKGFICL